MSRKRRIEYASGEPPAPSRLPLRNISEEVASDVEQAQFADHCEALEIRVADRAGSQFDAASPLPIDGTVSRADAALEQELVLVEQRWKDGSERVCQHIAAVDEAQTRLANTPPPWSALRMGTVTSGFVLLSIALGAITGIILAPTVDEYYLGNYIRERFDNEMVAAVAGYAVAVGVLACTCLGQLAFVLAVRGDLGTGRKLLLVVADLVVSLGWGAQRLSHGFSAMAVSITLIEFGALLVYSVALVGLAVALKRNAERCDPYRDAKQRLRATRRAQRQVEQDQRAIEQERDELLARVAERENAVRRSADVRALAEETARVAAMVATSKLAHAAVASASRQPYELVEDAAVLEQARRGFGKRGIN